MFLKSLNSNSFRICESMRTFVFCMQNKTIHKDQKIYIFLNNQIDSNISNKKCKLNDTPMFVHDERAYDGRFLALQEDIMVVSINYRLNSFGFLNWKSNKGRSTWTTGRFMIGNKS